MIRFWKLPQQVNWEIGKTIGKTISIWTMETQRISRYLQFNNTLHSARLLAISPCIFFIFSSIIFKFLTLSTSDLLNTAWSHCFLIPSFLGKFGNWSHRPLLLKHSDSLLDQRFLISWIASSVTSFHDIISVISVIFTSTISKQWPAHEPCVR